MKKLIITSILALLIFSAQAQFMQVPCDSIDITVDSNSTHYQPSFSSNWIASSIYNNGTLSPYFVTSSLSGIFLSEDSSFTHNVLNMNPSGSFYDTIVTCFTVNGLDSLPNTPMGTISWSCGIDFNGIPINCDTFAWNGSSWNIISTTPPAPNPSWDCDPNIGCYDPGNGLGQYSTYAACDTSCSSNNWSNFNVCDSLEVIIISSTTDSVTVGTNLSSLQYTGPVMYDWTLFNPINAGGNNIFGTTVSTIANPTFSVNPLDTTLYFLTIQVLDSTGTMWNCIYPFVVFWDNNQWIALKTTNPMTSINEIANNEKKLVKVVDLLGKETKIEKNKVLFYIYDDGSVDKKIIR